MAFRVLTLAALVQCSAGNDSTDLGKNSSNTVATKDGWVPAGCFQVGKFQVDYKHSKCMDIALNGAQGPFNGARIQVWDCNKGFNQNFIWCSDGHIVSFINRNFCLDVPGGNPQNPSDLQMWECQQGAVGQIWSYDSKNKVIYPQSTGGSMCVDTDGGSVNDGTGVNIYYHKSSGDCTTWHCGKAADEANLGNLSAPDKVDSILV